MKYSAQFNRFPFTGTSEKMLYTKDSPRKHPKPKGKGFQPSRNLKSNATGVPQPREMGGPKMDFIKEHNLSRKSHLMNWFNALMTLTPGDNLETLEEVDVTGDSKTKFAISNWTAYTNTKAMLVSADQSGQIY